MKTSLKRVNPEDYILSALKPDERLEAAFKLAKEVFHKTSLTVQDIDSAVKSLRKKAYGKK